MKLKDLQDAMIAAMKAKDKPRKDSISALVSAVKKAGIDAGCRDDIPEDMVNQVALILQLDGLLLVKGELSKRLRTDIIQKSLRFKDVIKRHSVQAVQNNPVAFGQHILRHGGKMRDQVRRKHHDSRRAVRRGAIAVQLVRKDQHPLPLLQTIGPAIDLSPRLPARQTDQLKALMQMEGISDTIRIPAGKTSGRLPKKTNFVYNYSIFNL